MFQLARVKEIVVTNDPLIPRSGVLEGETGESRVQIFPAHRSSAGELPQAVQTLQGKAMGFPLISAVHPAGSAPLPQ